jgi:hypothetical protein
MREMSINSMLIALKELRSLQRVHRTNGNHTRRPHDHPISDRARQAGRSQSAHRVTHDCAVARWGAAK